MSDLFKKYDVPGPRYTSYPTVPYWENNLSPDQWFQDLRQSAATPEQTLSLYLHLPYCETRCWFCACNAHGTRDHRVEEPYADGLLKELGIYLSAVPELKRAALRQIHLGGGTPTFFSAESLERLLSGLNEALEFSRQHFDGSVEVNPRYTSIEQINLFAQYGFRRISFGVQDFDPKVQEAINRRQTPEETGRLMTEARAVGFESVNFDLIYGLPYQSEESIAATVNSAIRLAPDRVALYSLALVPWVQPAHKHLVELAPKGEEKRRLYEVSREAFLEAGYIEIGMDHFALPSDSLAKAAACGTLHRNFMGYTDYHSNILLGLGASAISESPGCYHQNEKDLNKYLDAVKAGLIPTIRGHVMTEQDKKRRSQILSLMTRFWVALDDEAESTAIIEALSPMAADGLVSFLDGGLKLTEAGRPFLRNACMAFDERLRRKEPHTRIFSQTV